MARQGSVFTQKEIDRIVGLLASTDMTLKEIAERMQCSPGAIASINRRIGVRDYGGRRSTWQYAGAGLVASAVAESLSKS